MSTIVLKTAEEIELMRESALIVSKTLGMLAGEIRPGISTLKLDALAETFIRDHGAEPGFLGLYDFPNTLCMSPNAQVVHGIPNDDPLEEGDIISIDCGALKNNFYGDHAYTFAVGDIDLQPKCAIPKRLYMLVLILFVGNRIGIGLCYSNVLRKGRLWWYANWSVTAWAPLCEGPEVPNYGRRGQVCRWHGLGHRTMINQHIA